MSSSVTWSWNRSTWTSRTARTIRARVSAAESARAASGRDGFAAFRRDSCQSILMRNTGPSSRQSRGPSTVHSPSRSGSARELRRDQREARVHDLLLPPQPVVAPGQDVRVREQDDDQVLNRVDEDLTAARAGVTERLERCELGEHGWRVFRLQREPEAPRDSGASAGNPSRSGYSPGTPPVWMLVIARTVASRSTRGPPGREVPQERDDVIDPCDGENAGREAARTPSCTSRHRCRR